MAQIKLKGVRICYPNLFTPKPYNNKPGTEAYSAAFLIPKSDKEQIKAVKAAILEAAKEKFNGDETKAKKFIKSVKGSKQQYCFRDGDTKTGNDAETFADHHFIAGRSATVAPKVVDNPAKDKKGNERLLTEKDGKIYPGCYVNVVLDIYAQTGENAGVRCGLKGVQFHSDGAALGGGAPASVDDFDDLSDGTDAPDMDDDEDDDDLDLDDDEDEDDDF